MAALQNLLLREQETAAAGKPKEDDFGDGVEQYEMLSKFPGEGFFGMVRHCPVTSTRALSSKPEKKRIIPAKEF